MQDLFSIRKKHGAVYVTAFEDGQLVPWHPLSIGDYIKYNRDYNRGLIPSSIIEDEIYRKCVVDPVYLSQMPFLNAGVISVVVMNIWQYSGPVGIQEFNSDLQIARNVMFGDGTRAIQELIQLITMAFPYKPEEVEAMDYETFMLRLVQSEKKLLELGIIKESIEMKDLTEQKPGKKKLPHKVLEPDKPKLDAKKLWEVQQGLRPPATPPVNPQQKAPQPSQSESPNSKWYKVSPVLEATNKKKINFQAEAASADDTMLDSHERIEPQEVKDFIRKKKLGSERDKMIEDARWIYADLLKELAKK